MRVIFVLDGTYPEGMASSARMRSYSRGLRNNGVDVRILIPEARVRKGCVNFNSQRKGKDVYGAEYRYFGGLVRSRNIFVRQIMDIIGSVSTIVYLMFILKRGDIVFIYEGGMIWQMIVSFVARLRGCKSGVEMNELPYVFEEMDNRERKREMYFRRILPRMDFAVSISETLTELLNARVPSLRVINIPILVENHSPKAEIPVVDYPYIFHSGSLSEQKDGICGALEAFAIARKSVSQDLHYVLTGNLENAADKDGITRIIDEYALHDKVVFLGYIDKDMLHRYQAGCSLCIVNKLNTEQNRYCFPTKLGEYLSYGKPVVVTSVGEVASYLFDRKNAWVFRPGDIAGMADAIVRILSFPEETFRIAAEGHKLAMTEFNPDIRMTDFIKWADRL